MKALPKKWFPQRVAKISLKKVDSWAEIMKEHSPYFDNWEEAHAFMVNRAANRIRGLEKNLAAARTHAEKVAAMKKP